MRKVLIVAYYWPPAGGGGVQRWLKFARYLPDAGWQPIVYTPSNPDYPLIDETLLQDVPEDITVIRQPIREPRRWFAKWMGSNASKEQRQPSADQLFYIDPAQRSWKQNLSIWMRGNLFIPDARVLWVRPSIRFLRDYLRKHRVDAIVTTGPPHSLHLIGLGLKRSNPTLRWIADFRDPWTHIEYYDRLMLTGFADRRHHRLEQRILKQADEVVTVSPSWARMLGEIRGDSVHVVTNGFDEKDFAGKTPEPDDAVTICHVGTLAMDRNPQALWHALSDLVKEGFLPQSLTLKFLGSTSPGVLQSLQQTGLDYQDLGYLEHRGAIREMQKSQVLLLLVNTAHAQNAQGRIPGKVFEYLAAGRPILAICTRGSDVADLLMTYGHVVLSPGELSRHTLQQAFEVLGAWSVKEEQLKQFTRRYLATEMAGILKENNS